MAPKRSRGFYCINQPTARSEEPTKVHKVAILLLVLCDWEKIDSAGVDFTKVCNNYLLHT